MIEGELYQLTKTGDANITEEEHFEIIRRKTAFLFAGCAEIGGLLGDASPEQRVALREYGFDLGIAFQIVDDVLDYMAEETALGKPIGGDLREGKVTLPVILLLQRGGPEATALIHGVVADGQLTTEKWIAIKGLLNQHGAIDSAFERAVMHAERAKKYLADAFQPSPEREGLIALADYVISRDR
jgi:octaprenyl-diphosphate synthase